MRASHLKFGSYLTFSLEVLEFRKDFRAWRLFSTFSAFLIEQFSVSCLGKGLKSRFLSFLNILHAFCIS